MRVLGFLSRLRWIDGSPLMEHIEPYRRRLFEEFFSVGEDGRLRFNLGLFGRAKKNWKTADKLFAELYALLTPSAGGNQVLDVANDKDQARDTLSLLRLILKANPTVADMLVVKRNIIERKDGEGFIEVLPAQDAVGAHGKTYRLLGVDEIHGYRNWDLLEALSPDPTRPDVQQWVTTYASLHHRPGAPLHDLLKLAKVGTDPRMLFSWYAADFTTDPDFEDATPERRANPSMSGWADPGYLAQQQRRLPGHKYRRLHLNLSGSPEGSAFQPEPVMDAVVRGVKRRRPEEGIAYRAFVDMSGGSNDDATLALGHVDTDGRFIVDDVVDQGAPAPFDPRSAVKRFAVVLREYNVSTVIGDRYAGETFRRDFERHGIKYDVAAWTKSQIYEALEPRLNAHEVAFPDVPKLEQQLLGLVWRGGKIDHPSGEHDDYVNAAAGVVQVLGARPRQSQALWIDGAWDDNDDPQALAGMRGEVAEMDAEIERLEREMGISR